MKPYLRFVIGYFCFVVTANFLFWALVGLHFGPVEDLYRGGLVVKLKPLGRAYVFAHGSYNYGWEWKGEYDFGLNFVRGKGTCWLDAQVYHEMRLDGARYSTFDYVEELREEGFEHVWGSWCESGDHPYVTRYANGTEVAWPDWVSRNECPDTTIPVFWGLGFVRV